MRRCVPPLLLSVKVVGISKNIRDTADKYEHIVAAPDHVLLKDGHNW